MIVISGPTSVGKTNAAIQVAKRLTNCEIVSADSVSVYKGLDVGSGKVAPTRTDGVSHHLLDETSPFESFDVSKYCKRAHVIIKDITNRGKTPIIVGGSGFYISSLLYGTNDAPPSTPRAQYWLKQAINNPIETFNYLISVDPTYANTISMNNNSRVARALDVFESSGRPFSSYLQVDKTKTDLEYDYRCYYLHIPRVLLYRLIDFRCEEMIKNGLFNEIVDLMSQKDFTLKTPALNSIGYKQGFNIINSRQIDSKSIDKFIIDYQCRTRQFSHKQYSWFRKMPIFKWIYYSEIINKYNWMFPPSITPQPNAIDLIIDSFNKPIDQFDNSFDPIVQSSAQTLTPQEVKYLRGWKPQRRIYTDGIECLKLSKHLRTLIDSKLGSSRFVNFKLNGENEDDY